MGQREKINVVHIATKYAEMSLIGLKAPLEN